MLADKAVLMAATAAAAAAAEVTVEQANAYTTRNKTSSIYFNKKCQPMALCINTNNKPNATHLCQVVTNHLGRTLHDHKRHWTAVRFSTV